MIYFIYSPDSHAIKIGYTQNDVKQRLSALKTASPCKLYLLGTINGDIEKEKELHEKFKSSHKIREWFYVDDKILAFLESVKCNKSSLKKSFRLHNRGGSREGGGRPPSGKPWRQRATFTLQPELIKVLDNEASKHNISRSQALEAILKTWLSNDSNELTELDNLMNIAGF